jgi:hypothetical protein
MNINRRGGAAHVEGKNMSKYRELPQRWSGGVASDEKLHQTRMSRSARI